MKILVTGASGYIGRHVVNSLLDLGTDVIAADLNTNEVDARAIRRNVNVFNLENVAQFYCEIGQPEVVLHMAWREGFNHNSPAHIADLPLHFSFIDQLLTAGISRVAVMGSMHEIGYWVGKVDESTPRQPRSYYGISKDALRRFLEVRLGDKAEKLQWLRAFYITGDDFKNRSIFAKLLEAERNGVKEFPLSTGTNKYDFISVQELANQISATVTQREINGVIHCCTGAAVSLREKIEAFIKSHNLKIRPKYGAFPDRVYDSPEIFGDSAKIRAIMSSRARS